MKNLLKITGNKIVDGGLEIFCFIATYFGMINIAANIGVPFTPFFRVFFIGYTLLLTVMYAVFARKIFKFMKLV